MDTRAQHTEYQQREESATPPRIYSAPRRFDVSTLLVVTVAYALLFVLIGAIPHVEPPILVWASAIIGLFLAYIAIAQIVLYRGECPRLASFVAGMSAFAAFGLWTAVRYQASAPSLARLIFFAVYVVGFGGTTGYLAGATVGGVFLIADKLRTRISSFRINRVQDEADEPW